MISTRERWGTLVLTARYSRRSSDGGALPSVLHHVLADEIDGGRGSGDGIIIVLVAALFTFGGRPQITFELDRKLDGRRDATAHSTINNNLNRFLAKVMQARLKVQRRSRQTKELDRKWMTGMLGGDTQKGQGQPTAVCSQNKGVGYGSQLSPRVHALPQAEHYAEEESEDERHRRDESPA